MPGDGFENPDFDRIHDGVFIESIDRRERLIKFIAAKVGIAESEAREDHVLADALLQLVREDSAIIGEFAEEVCIFLDEWEKFIPTEKNEILRDKNDRVAVNNAFYSREKAKAYIDAYWKQYNPAYPSFHKGGGDCANFASQVLAAGGMPWADSGKGYTHSGSWYCKPGATNKDGDKRITLSWKVAASFKAHWQNRVERHMMLSYAEIQKNIDSVSHETHIGDIVQFCYSSGVPYHTLIVTGFNMDPEYHVRDIVLASHTHESNTRSLYRTVLKYPADYKLRVYIIKAGE